MTNGALGTKLLGMDTTDYRLPDGRIVRVDSTAAKGAAFIGFELKGGRVVEAVRADIPLPLSAADLALARRIAGCIGETGDGKDFS